MSHLAILLNTQNTVPGQTYPHQSQQINMKSFGESLLLALSLNDHSVIKDVNSVSDLSQQDFIDLTIAPNVSSEEKEKDPADSTHYAPSLNGSLTPTPVESPNALELEAWNGSKHDTRIDSGEDVSAEVKVSSGGFLSEDRNTEMGTDMDVDVGTNADALNRERSYASSSTFATSLNTSVIYNAPLRESKTSESNKATESSDRNHISSVSMAAIDTVDTVQREKHTHADLLTLKDDSKVHSLLTNSSVTLASRYTFDVHIESEIVAETGVEKASRLPTEAERRVTVDAQANIKSDMSTDSASELEASRLRGSDSISENPRGTQLQNDRRDNSVSIPFRSQAMIPQAVSFVTDSQPVPVSELGVKRVIESIDSPSDGFQNTPEGKSDTDGDSLRTSTLTGISEFYATGVRESHISMREGMPDELYPPADSAMGLNNPGQTGSTNLTSSPVESARVDISSRVERVVEMQEAVRSRPMSEMTLKLENYNGESDSIRVSLRGSHLETTIAVSESVRANEILSRLPELKRSLDRQGFDNNEVSVISEEDGKREQGSHFRDHRKQSNQDEHK